jgi:hypothetical protein
VRRRAALLLLAVLAAPLLAAGPATAADPLVAFTVVPLTFTVQTGPDDATTCTVLGDLRIPVSASSAKKAVALLTTNGFGGSKDDGGTQGNRSFAEQYAKRGYVTLSSSSSTPPSGTARSPTSSPSSSPAAPGSRPAPTPAPRTPCPDSSAPGAAGRSTRSSG